MSTASALERLLACAPSAVLPHINTSGDEHAARGSAIHQFCRSIIAGTDRKTALAAVDDPSWRETCERIDFGQLCSGFLDVRAEAAYRLNIETDEVTFLGLNIGRKYPPRGPHDIDGTNDFEGRRFDGIRIVGDIKTGQEVTACEHNPQMRFHARVQMLKYDIEKVDARIVYVREDGSVHVDAHVFTRFELDAFGDELIAMRATIEEAKRLFAETGSVTVTSGEHCRYCPAMQACPRYTALARSMVGELRSFAMPAESLIVSEDATADEKKAARIEAIRARFALMDQDKQGAAWLLTTDAERLVEDVKEALKMIARQTPIPLTNGKIVKEGRSMSRRLSNARALAMLVQKGATNAELASLYDEEATYPVRAVNDKDRAPAKKRAKRSAA